MTPRLLEEGIDMLSTVRQQIRRRLVVFICGIEIHAQNVVWLGLGGIGMIHFLAREMNG